MHKIASRPEGKIAVILEKRARPELEEIFGQRPVWAPKLPDYEKIAKRVRRSLAPMPVTLFEPDTSMSPQEEFLLLLPTIDLHHGEYTDSPWDFLEVYGVVITGEIVAALREYGVALIMPTSSGFHALRARNKA